MDSRSHDARADARGLIALRPPTDHRTAILLLALLIVPLPARAAELSVVTFNVLVEVSKAKDVPYWKDRRDDCARLLRARDPDLVGLQETTMGQVRFFLDALPGFEAVYAEKFTDATLLYRKETFEELGRGHWWLSPTPEKMSTGFGNFLPRVLVWARLRHRASGRELFVFNTHFDNTSPSQEKMAALCREKRRPFMETGKPLLWLGDFNTDQKRGKYELLVADGWKDAYLVSEKASASGRDDNVSTVVDGQKRIDHILYHGPGIEPVSWERIEPPTKGKLYSDHYAVAARFRLAD